MRRKQDKEREAAGLPPVQRLGARAAAPQRGQRGGPTGRGGQRGTPARGAAPSGRGGGSGRTFHQPDKNLYVHLIGNLKKKNLLPVVVFTFSKKRCEENAGTLTNLDLATAGEKSEVHVTIEKALSRLKGRVYHGKIRVVFMLKISRDGQATTSNQAHAGPSFPWYRCASWRSPTYRKRGKRWNVYGQKKL